MTSLREILHKGSYRNIPFYWSSGSTTGGRKTVLFDFPNSDYRLSQDLGQIPNKISLNVFTIGTAENYYSNRDALITALNTAGMGELSHPTLGLLNCVVAEPYTYDESLQELGKCSFSITFAVVKKDDFLPQASSSTGTISKNLKNNLIYSAYALDNNLNISNLVNQNALSDNISSIQSLFGNATNLITDSVDAQTYSSKLLNFSNYNLLSSSFGANTATAFSSISNLVTNATDRFTFFKSMFDYGDNTISTITPTTKANTEQLANQSIINQSVQSNALYYAIDAMTEKTYLTETELASDADIIYAQIDKLASEFVNNADVYENLMETKIAFSQFVNAQSAALYRISTANVNNVGLTELCYQYYGNLDNYELLNSLNNVQNPSLLNGNINIVTSG